MPDSIHLGLLPFFHSFGLMTVIGNIIKCQKVIILSYFKENLFLETVQRYKVTTLSLVPPLVIFLAKSHLIKQYDLSSVKMIGCGAAPLSKEIEEKISKM